MGLTAIICGVLLSCTCGLTDLSYRSDSSPEKQLIIPAHGKALVKKSVFDLTFREYVPPFVKSNQVHELSVGLSNTVEIKQISTTVFNAQGFRPCKHNEDVGLKDIEPL